MSATAGTPAARVVVVGPTSWNTNVLLDTLPEPRPHTVHARSARDTLGGTSAGKVLHLADLGIPVTCVTVLGDDDPAARIRTALTHPGVELLVEVVSGPSERHINLMTDRGERVSLYLSTPEPPPTPVPSAVATAIAAATDVVLDLAQRTVDLLSSDVPRQARARGTRTWTDLHDYDGSATFHRPFLAAADHVFLNADGLGDPLPFLHACVRSGARLAVCTLGADGAVAVDAGGREHRVAATPTEVVDTNGAGDAFLAGYLAAAVGGADVPEALKAATRQAVRALASVHLSPLLDDPSAGRSGA
ncbi:carbohydrate kinase family protein [Pengzhenrongella frigida]|uniref:Carbohydrate kinase family protein n=1 Tax=Pengzhenrongella frigida TaxID=1259133 RepID=A0A4V1ZHP7_9MICO|nr:carbohydrate kinase family protein [Cellulomonas sp. HLT2-17]RYV52784.1 carbohydrate kinase family protein [Cellulomonas sp. HLT2-17]